MRLIAVAAVCAAVFMPLARAGTPADCGVPAAMSDGWPVSPTAQQGLDPKLICSTGPDLASPQEPAPHGVVVIRRGVLVYLLLRQRQSLNLVVAVTAPLSSLKRRPARCREPRRRRGAKFIRIARGDLPLRGTGGALSCREPAQTLRSDHASA
jgi:hypothetical protein